MHLFEAKKRREEALAKCDAIVSATENEKRQMTASESSDFDGSMKEVEALSADITRMEALNTLRGQFPKGVIIPGAVNNEDLSDLVGRKRLTREYFREFAAWAKSRGKVVGSALASAMDEGGGFTFPAIRAAQYEGSNAAGGYAVPLQVAGEIVPLAPPVMGVQKLASVIPTVMDIRYPRKGAHGTAAAKAESGAATNNFGGTDPALEQFTLSAFMVGHLEDASWELLQDVNQFQSFMQDDILLSIAVFKEGKFVNGSGAGEPQGLIGNTADGAVCTTHAYADILDSTFDLLGALNPVYEANANFLMTKATAIGLRKAQKASNLFEPVFTRVGGQDYLHGYPVNYSASMPANGAAVRPILYGDFKSGYLIGERGGAGVNVKILDQTKAVAGLVEILGYQRVDGRVRRSEAIQALLTT